MKYDITVDESNTFSFAEEELDSFDIIRKGENVYHLIKDNQSYAIEILHLHLREKKVELKVNGATHTVTIFSKLERLISEMGLNESLLGSGQVIESPMPGLVLDIKVQEGDIVEVGQQLIVLEAMKMENVIKSDVSGIVSVIHVNSSQAVEKGELLIEITGNEE